MTSELYETQPKSSSKPDAGGANGNGTIPQAPPDRWVRVMGQPIHDEPRRRFLNRLLGTWAGGVAASILYPIVRYLVPPDIPEAATLSVTAGKTATLAPNSARIVPFGSTPVIVVRTARNELRAFAATCTHLACTVQYRPDLEQIWCACHNGHYDLNGRNISGPPPAPLAIFDVNVKDEDIVILRKV